MKFSEKTISVMKNFATINQSIVIDPGNVLKTITPMKTMFAVAELDVEFPASACIYDVSRFLSVLSLYSDPDIDFKDNHFVISEGRRKMKYVYAQRNMIVEPPAKNISLPSEDVDIEISWNDLDACLKASSRLQLPEIAICGDGSSIVIRCLNSEVDSSDTYDVQLDAKTSDEFKFTFLTEKLKMIPQNYNVKISKKGISEFKGEYVTYFIPVEQKTSFFK